MKIGKPEAHVKHDPLIPGRDCVEGQVYSMANSDSPRLCVNVAGKLYMVKLATGHQSNTLIGDTFTKYRHLPDAYLTPGEPA